MRLYPALDEARLDRNLMPRDRTVLLFLAGELSFDAFMRVKGEQVAAATGFERSWVARSFATLIKEGYLDRGPCQEHGALSLRLVFDRRGRFPVVSKVG